MPSWQLLCVDCGRVFAFHAREWRCSCGAPLRLNFRPRFGKGWIRQDRPGFWRYRRALPIASDRAVVSLGEAVTPLIRLEVGGRMVLVKADHLLPSGSFKDRGAAVLISHAREIGVQELLEDSSGNAGAAVAAYAARAGIRSRIYVPASTSAQKLIQIRFYGAGLERISGSRQEAALAAQEASGRTYYASHVWNPYFLHGTKTFAYELCEQLVWRPPDILFLPVGNGSLLLGVHLGFTEMLAAGIISRRPRLFAVQAEACSPIHRSWQDLAAAPVQPTLAEGIAVAAPPRSAEIIAAVRETGGEILAVSEAAIHDAVVAMGKKGFFIEPTAAVVFAAIERRIPALRPSTTVATLITGSGLKSAGEICRVLADV